MAQTLLQFNKKIEELLDSTRESIRINADKAFRSGAVDTESYEDNYLLPKIILVACLENETDLWRPSPRDHKANREIKKANREIKNLRHFI